MPENGSIETQLAKHELRITALEKLIETQTNALTKLQSRITIIGTGLISVIGVSSEPGGAILRMLLSGG